jgi:formylmethanofuran dehydrogenase subunit C
VKPLVLTLRSQPSQRLDLSSLAPDRLLGRSLKEIEAIDIATTKAEAKVGDFFRLRDGDPHELRFEGGSERFDFVGAKLLAGYSIHVEGDVGMGLGRHAQGGTIKVKGDAGAYAASGMTAGRIEIAGDAGGFLCAPFAGELAGMAGGRVIVRGSVGDRAGDRLRRGIVVVEGDAGEDLGSRAIAGTIVLLGKAAGRLGYLNKRASLVLAQRRDFGPTYVDCGAHYLAFAMLFARALDEDSRHAARLLTQRLQRYAGDTAVYGKGEILTPA